MPLLSLRRGLEVDTAQWEERAGHHVLGRDVNLCGSHLLASLLLLVLSAGIKHTENDTG